MRRILIKRLLSCIVVFAIVDACIERYHAALEQWFVRLGRGAGCAVTQTGTIAWGPNGPFIGEGLKVTFFNTLARHGPWVMGATAGFFAALGVYAACRGLERWRHRGVTRCGNCGYALAGLKEPRCPECGLVI